MELDDVLSDKEPEKVEVEEKPDAKPEEGYQSRKKAHQEKEFGARGLERNEHGQFVKKEPEAEVKVEPEVKPEVRAEVKPEPQELTAKEKAFLAQATDERRKRQELEQRLSAMEKLQPKPEQKPFWEDPEAALKQREESTQETLRKHEEQMRQIALNTRWSTAEVIARSKHADYDEKIAVFGEIVQKNPHLVQEWLSQPDPAEYAYTIGKNQQELRQAGDLEGYKKKIQEETAAKVRAELEAQYKAKAEEQERMRAAIPGSLSNAHGSPVNKTVWSGPPSLGDILAK
jgi:hypothetical protein